MNVDDVLIAREHQALTRNGASVSGKAHIGLVDRLNRHDFNRINGPYAEMTAGPLGAGILAKTQHNALSARAHLIKAEIRIKTDGDQATDKQASLADTATAETAAWTTTKGTPQTLLALPEQLIKVRRLRSAPSSAATAGPTPAAISTARRGIAPGILSAVVAAGRSPTPGAAGVIAPGHVSSFESRALPYGVSGLVGAQSFWFNARSTIKCDLGR